MFFQEFWLAHLSLGAAVVGSGEIHAWLFCCDYTQGTNWRRDAAIEQLE